MKRMKKGNVLIHCLLALVIITICIMLVYNLDKVSESIIELKEAKDMNKYWRNLERYKIFIPIEKPVDIVY